MIGVHDLPAINASLNAAATVLLLTGYYFIRHKRVQAHRRTMIAAFCFSCAFLVCYIVYHAQAGNVRFLKTGPIRPVYFFILTTHVILAAAVPVLAIITLSRALRGDFARHRKIARWTFPIWLYVSVTGVVVYVMLYHL